VNCDLINNKNPTVIKLGTCIVNAYCQLLVKCYIVKVFVVDSNLSFKLKTHSFADLCLYELFSVL